MKLADKYRLESILGEGGFGIVYAGVHEWTGRPIAAKVLDYSLTTKEEFVTRFLREARVAAKLDHPHVVDVLDMGKDDDGTVYLVLEFLRGQDMSELLDSMNKLSLRRAATYLLPIMDALVDAHELGIVHRDLKPANIFLSKDKNGRVVPKLLDFGIAKDVHDGLVKTLTGAIYGTPDYMSPEQAAGASEVGPRSDVWAMGAVFFRVLTGELPYRADDKKPILLQLISSPPRSLGSVDPEIPNAIVEVIDKALTHEDTGRFAHMGEFFAAFVRALREVDEFPSRLEPLLRRRDVLPSDSGFPDAMTVEADPSDHPISGVVVAGTDPVAESERELAHADTGIQKTPMPSLRASVPDGVAVPVQAVDTSIPAAGTGAVPAAGTARETSRTTARTRAKKKMPWVIPGAVLAMVAGAFAVIQFAERAPFETEALDGIQGASAQDIQAAVNAQIEHARQTAADEQAEAQRVEAQQVEEQQAEVDPQPSEDLEARQAAAEVEALAATEAREAEVREAEAREAQAREARAAEARARARRLARAERRNMSHRMQTMEPTMGETMAPITLIDPG